MPTSNVAGLLLSLAAVGVGALVTVALSGWVAEAPAVAFYVLGFTVGPAVTALVIFGALGAVIFLGRLISGGARALQRRTAPPA